MRRYSWLLVLLAACSGDPEPAEVMDAVGANGFNLSRREVTAEIVEQCHATGRPVAVYTVNRKRTMRGLIELGVNALFTDHPDRLLDVLGEER